MLMKDLSYTHSSSLVGWSMDKQWANKGFMWVPDPPLGPELSPWNALKIQEYEYLLRGAAISITDVENQSHDLLPKTD